MDVKKNVISIRVDDNIKNKLISQAESENLTINSLVGQIVSKHMSECMIAHDLGFTSIRKTMLKTLFEKIPNEDIIEMSKTTGKKYFKDTAIYICGTYDKTAVLKTLDAWFNHSNIPVKKMINEKDTKIIIQHQLGSSWALYFKNMMKEVFIETGIKADSFVKTVDSISFRILN